MLVPSQRSESSEASDQARDILSDLDSDSLPQTPSTGLSPAHGAKTGLAGRDMEADLDLLPTKEEVVKHIGEEDRQPLSTDGDCAGVRGVLQQLCSVNKLSGGFGGLLFLVCCHFDVFYTLCCCFDSLKICLIPLL